MTDGQGLAATVAAGFAAGVMNAIAGGGTVVTFPTLLLLGVDSIRANATSTVALVPGAASSMWGYRREVATHREWFGSLLLPSVLGGAVGSLLLVVTPERVFAAMAPFLVLFATLLFLLQIVRARRRAAAAASGSLPPRVRPSVAFAAQLAVGVYGGYFGAGIGILMLVLLGAMGLSDIHAMNGLKNFFGMCINGVACACFVTAGLVEWRVALVMMAGAVAGGLAGAKFARGIGRERARWAVVAVGLLATGILLWRG